MVVIRKTRRKNHRTDPSSLAGKLVYFSGLGDFEEWHQLDQKLLLVSEDQHDSDYNSSMVFGYIINTPDTETLRDYFRKAGQIVHHSVQMIELLNNVDGEDAPFAIYDGALHFITRKSKNKLTSKTDFAQFSAYEFEDLKAAEKFALNLVESKTRFIVTSSFVVMDRETLVELQRQGFAKIRDAEANIVLEPHSGARAWLAFPDEFSIKF